jgi:hypothetical protein
MTGHSSQEHLGFWLDGGTIVYGHRKLLSMSLLKEGVELLRYDEVVKALREHRP